MFALRLKSRPEAGTRVPLAEQATLLVGRGADCGLRLSDPGASRVHCRIVVAADKVIIEDAGSRWGTLVNGARVESRELRPGDEILIGDTTLVLELDVPRAATAMPFRERETLPPRPVPSVDEIDQPSPPPRAPLRTVNFQSLVGQKFLRFRVGSMVARTRSGALFRAFDPGKAAADVPNASGDERVIALKVFAPEVLGDEKTTRRFIRAIRTMLPLQHEHLVRLHTAGRWQGLCFAASEFVEGESLTQVIQRVGIAGMLDWRRAWQIAVAITRALEYAHERGIIHRNITPGHILVSERQDVIKLGDLTLAKAFDGCSERITQPGEVVGDLRYLAPEQFTGDAWCDGRSDIYSLGATLYAVLTGKPPFDGATTGEIIRAVLSDRPEPPSRLHIGIPPQFEGVVLRMLARFPDERYPSVRELLRELDRVRKYAGF